MRRVIAFTHEQVRTPFTLALVVTVPVLFVFSAAGALSDFATALGGSLAGDAAIALGAGWAAAFVSGALGFFEAASSREADRRLALAGAGAARVAASRIAAAVALAAIATTASFVTLLARADVEHPGHAAAAVLGFALLYLGVGVLVGSLITSPLEGSLLVVFIFLLDVFAGPGMTQSAAPWSFSRKAADVLISAATGRSSPAQDWLWLTVVTVASLAAAFAVFVTAARSRA